MKKNLKGILIVLSMILIFGGLANAYFELFRYDPIARKIKPTRAIDMGSYILSADSLRATKITAEDELYIGTTRLYRLGGLLLSSGESYLGAFGPVYYGVYNSPYLVMDNTGQDSSASRAVRRSVLIDSLLFSNGTFIVNYGSNFVFKSGYYVYCYSGLKTHYIQAASTDTKLFIDGYAKGIGISNNVVPMSPSTQLFGKHDSSWARGCFDSLITNTIKPKAGGASELNISAGSTYLFALYPSGSLTFYPYANAIIDHGRSGDGYGIRILNLHYAAAETLAGVNEITVGGGTAFKKMEMRGDSLVIYYGADSAKFERL